MANKCRLCGKALKSESEQFGDDCQARFSNALSILETTPEEIGKLFLTGDATVQRWLSAMTTALIRSIRFKEGAARNRRDAKVFLEAARREAANVTDVSIAWWRRRRPNADQYSRI